MLDRRRFLFKSLQTGLLGGLHGKIGFLGLGGLCLVPILRAGPAPSLQNLREQDLRLLEKLMPAAIGLSSGGEHEPLIRQAVLAIDPMVTQLSSANRRDLMTLFDLLQCPLTRIFMGLWPSWDAAQVQDVDAMFARWAQSRFQILRLAYQSTVQILQFAWYSQAAATKAVGYPGPPDSIRPYLAQVKGVYDGLK